MNDRRAGGVRPTLPTYSKISQDTCYTDENSDMSCQVKNMLITIFNKTDVEPISVVVPATYSVTSSSKSN